MDELGRKWRRAPRRARGEAIAKAVSMGCSTLCRPAQRRENGEIVDFEWMYVNMRPRRVAVPSSSRWVLVVGTLVPPSRIR